MASQARAVTVSSGYHVGWTDEHQSSALSVVSQELRTSLNLILGFVEMLADPSFGASQRDEFVRRIRTEGQNLLARVEGAPADGDRPPYGPRSVSGLPHIGA